MVYNDVRYENVANEIKVNRTWEFKNCYFQYFFFELDYFSYLLNKIHKIWNPYS